MAKSMDDFSDPARKKKNLQENNRSTAKLINEVEVKIYNNSDYVMPVKLKSNNEGPYKCYKQSPKSWVTYRGAASIRIDSQGGKFVEYRLDSKNFYQVAWNPNKYCWDVFIVRY